MATTQPRRCSSPPLRRCAACVGDGNTVANPLSLEEAVAAAPLRRFRLQTSMPLEYKNETWHTEGSEYIGLDVTFIGWSGKIIGWLPPDSAGLNRYLVKYTDGVKEERDWLSEVDDWLTEESKQLLEQRRLEQRRLEQRRLEPEEGVAHDVETSKKKRKAATPAPAPTTTPVTTTASTTDKTRACKKKKQPKKPKKNKRKTKETQPARYQICCKSYSMVGIYVY